MSDIKTLVCLDPECAYPAEVRTHGEVIPLPDGTEVVTEQPGSFRPPFIPREVTAIEGNIATLSCGHTRSLWMKLQGEPA